MTIDAARIEEAALNALRVYREFGFATSYVYHYRARPGECE